MEIVLQKKPLMKSLLTIGLFFSYFFSFSQTPYGNEWINVNQSYAKLRISEKGIYKITYAQLQTLGFFSNGTATEGLQIFYLGEEIPLMIEGGNDNVFDINDYITFYAKPNNGRADVGLYKTGEQPNSEISLFEEEATYFITNSATEKGKRYQNINISSAGIIPETHIVYTASKNFADQYYPGQYVLDVMTFSDYIEGEGYFGSTFGLGQSQTQSLNTPDFLAGTNFKPKFETYVAGRSNASSTNPQGNNHHLNIKVDGLASNDVVYRGYKTVRISEVLNNTALPATTNISFTSVNDLGAVTDFQVPAYARITYPRKLDASSFNLLEFMLNSTNSTCLLNFSNTISWDNSLILNPNSSEAYTGIKNGALSTFVVKNTPSPFIVYNETAIKNTLLESVTFNLIDAASFNAKMLIVTHKSLLSAVDELASYKNSKGITTKVFKTEDLYDQFCYGIHHPLAIRNVSRYLIEKSSVKPEYLFLIGKGYEYTKKMISDDLVPTMGFPPSDNEFTAKIIDSTLAPALATGRLPAKSLEDVNLYLEKLRLFEQQPNEIWRKTIINITGGGNSSEDNSFSSYLRNLSNISDKEHFGSSTISYFKSVTDPITNNLTEKINKTIADGANLVTFLGHGSTTGTAVSVGRAQDIQRILFFFINGCSTGNAFTTASLGEDFILQSQRGAIGWIGTSSEGVASYLAGLANNFYQNSFKTNYGKSVASNISSSIRTYQNQNDALNKIHCQQYIYLGDPSISFYAPDKPDYEIKSNDISILESNVTANSASFNLSLIVKNIGKALLNDVKINVTRTLSDNTVINYPPQSFSRLFNTDTLNFSIDNDISNASGINKFTINIDPNSEIEELNELNNSADFTFLFASNGITLISPDQYGILASKDFSLKAQSNNLFTKTANYFFEIDSLKSFDSNWKKSSGVINSGLFANWNPNIVLEPNRVYYWRARLDADLTNGGQWQNSSFIYIPDSHEGWSQAHPQQFSDISLTNITPEFNFTNTVYPVRLSTRGQASTSTAERRIRIGASNTSPSFNGSEFTGIAIMAIDPLVSTKILNYPSSFNFKNDGVNGTGVFYFNTNISSNIDSLVKYLNTIPSNYNVLGVSGLNFAPNALPEIAKNAFKSLGLSVFENVNNGEPYVFIGKKGALPSQDIIELTAGTTEDVLYLHDIPYPWSNGTYTSEKIGPATKWDHASIKFNSNNNDIISSSIIGISKSGGESILKQSAGLDFDLTDINADLYPYLRVKTDIKDNIDFTAPKLDYWKIFYEGYPEISLNPELKNSFYASELQEGDSLRVSIGLSNIKEITSDSLLLSYKITKQDRTTLSGIAGSFAPLEGNKNVDATFSLPSLGLAGNNVLQLNLKPKNEKDQLEFNNYINYDFSVASDLKNPLIDLLFDGKHIINGEIVSPEPTITVFIIDENKFLFINDTSAIEVYLKSVNGDYRRLSFSSNEIILENAATSENNKASFIVKPGLLTDGIYTLKVVATDKSNNGNNSELFTDFEVINEQTISNFLPYPNPVVNTTRFVFQVTGEIPDKIKIQILTASGKIVKEIMKEELGNIHVGNNMSDYAWDGTDMYGDRLANGVYFYKVQVESNDGSSVKNKFNTTDKMFKNNIGKIYLMK